MLKLLAGVVREREERGELLRPTGRSPLPRLIALYEQRQTPRLAAGSFWESSRRAAFGSYGRGAARTSSRSLRPPARSHIRQRQGSSRRDREEDADGVNGCKEKRERATARGGKRERK